MKRAFMKTVIILLLVLASFWGAAHLRTARTAFTPSSSVQLAGELGDVSPTQGQEPANNSGRVVHVFA